MITVHVNDFKQWREQARELLRRHITPEGITWVTNQQETLLFDGGDFLSLPVQSESPKIPKEFITLAKNVACHRDDNRWSVLYSVAWRLVFEDRQLLDFAIDKQVAQLLAMQKAIGRDKHKMEAFVRFKKVSGTTESNYLNDDCEHYIAWFEPEHFILPAVAPFFIKRFNNMHWSILTPDICAHWNQEQLSFTEGVARADIEKDELETLWLQYYSSIFNPARVKVKAMQAEMPKKYWVNLPEAPLIAEMIRGADQRVDIMINDSVSTDWKKTSKSRYIKDKQQTLRSQNSNLSSE